MGKFVFAFSGGSIDASGDLDDEVMSGWIQWIGQLGSAIIDVGNSFGDSVTVSSSGSLELTDSHRLTGYLIVRAESLETAVTLTSGCPVLRHGGSISIYEAADL